MREPEFPEDALPGSLDHEVPLRESEKPTHADHHAVLPRLPDLEIEKDESPDYPIVVSQDKGIPDEMGPAPEDLP